MTYFICTSGGSGKGNTVVVTCDSDFAGQTITLANTGKSYSKTCPSSSPYTVTFYGIEAGTYTVSATVGGETYSETVIVQDISAVLNYGFNWKTWVDTAQYLDSSDYSTLADLLADEEAVRELFTEHATVDYMASATVADTNIQTILNDNYAAKWINLRDYALDTLYANTIIADYMDTADKYFYGEWVITDDTTTPPTWGPKGNVPVMTSNSAPYGSVSASSAYSSSAAYYAFDGNNSTWWEDNAEVSGRTARVVYHFTNPICPKKVSFILVSPHIRTIADNYVIVGSNDGTNYTPLLTISSANINQNEEYVASIENDTYYMYLGMQYLKKSNSTPSVNSLQFYGRELSVSVPKMDTNTTPYGEAIESSEWSSSYSAYKAFASTSVSGNGWGASSSDSFGNAYVGYDFLKGMRLRKVLAGFEKGTSNLTSVQFKIEGTNDKNGTWTPIDTITMNTFNAWLSFDMDSDVSYRYIRGVYLNNSASALSYGNGVHFQFYGLDYSEREFEEGTNKKWLYDHGLELVPFDYTCRNSTSFEATNDGKQLLSNVNSNSSSANFVALVPNEAIDLTDYNYLFGAVGDKLSSIMVFRVFASKPSAAGSGIATATYSVPLTHPNKMSIDVSAINQQAFPSVYNGNNGYISTCKELWLE